MFFINKQHMAQAPPLGASADFVLFTSVGAVSNTGITHLTGNVGTNSGLSTGFGNVDGVMHDNDGVSAQCSADLLILYNQLNAAVPTFFPAPLLGNGQTLNAGVYLISSPATLNLDLTLDGQGNPNAVFILQIQGSFSCNANSKVKLINGALACNVFWKVEGLVSLATGTTMRGTIVANNAAINLNVGDTLEGRALSTAGAITVNGVLAYTPLGCGSPVLLGPVAPVMSETMCYTIFSSIGPVTNVGITNVIGDIGSNNGLTTGFNPLFVVGMIHPVPDASTAACATDMVAVYNYLSALPFDIELLYPAQFGNNLVLTPHTYLLDAATTFTDTMYLNAQGNSNAVFVIKINGALSTSTYSRVILINGTLAENVYWMVEGAVTINDYSEFNGTIICNNGAMNLNTGMLINGRALTTTGAINTAAITANMPPGCGSAMPTITVQPQGQTVCEGSSASLTVTATGLGLTYQWRRGNLNLSNTGNISGVTTATLTINPVTLADAATDYNVIVMGTSGPNDTSSNVTLVVNTSPLITTAPLSQSACIGAPATFSVIASGTSLTYQWRRGLTNLINAGNISGVNTSVLSINPVSAVDAAIDYNVVISGVCSPVTNSTNVALVVESSPVITSPPTNQTVCENGSVSFSVTSTGTGQTYQWRKGLVNLINAGNISGVTTSTLTINPVTLADAATNYNVVVSGLCAPNANSPNTVLVVDSAPVAFASSNSPVCIDSTIFLTAQTVPGATYSWTGPNGFSSNTQNPVLIFAAPLNAGNYSLLVTLNGCVSSASITTVSVLGCSEIIFHIPEGFSPNGDAINDFFVITGIDYYPSNSFSIFNRWGNKVFDASPYQNSWDGKATTGMRIGGDELPVGTYFYVLDLGDGSKVYKGTIYLNK